MADVSDSDSDFEPKPSKEEEEWPDPDVASDTSEGAEIIRRADAALDEAMFGQARKLEPGYGTIPKALYVKARDHQDQLTQEERQLLLTRGDIVGKALAHPESLTPNEIHKLLFWPPPDELHANIQRATGGSLSTPHELIAKAKDAMDRGEFDTMINDEEAALLVCSFHPLNHPTYYRGGKSEALRLPGHAAAFKLLCSRLGINGTLSKAAARRLMPIPDAQPGQQREYRGHEIPNAKTLNVEQYNLGNVPENEFLTHSDALHALLVSSLPPRPPIQYPPINIPYRVQWPGPSQPPSQADLFGAGPWPDNHQREGAYGLFLKNTDLSGWDVQPGWYFLPKDQKQAYRAQVEATRRAAWVEFESQLATPPATRLENHLWSHTQYERGRLPPGTLKLAVTGFELFRDEVEAGLEGGLAYQEVVRRWEGLGEEQRKVYDDTAWERHREVMIATPRDWLAGLCRERGEVVPWES